MIQTCWPSIAREKNSGFPWMYSIGKAVLIRKYVF
jgi:hypothetical protein